MEAEKKPWQKPELIVLVRSKPEEAVLKFCKREIESLGYDILKAGCYYETECVKCYPLTTS